MCVCVGGGFGGRKESGQLRFGGRERPFKKPMCVALPVPPTPHVVCCLVSSESSAGTLWGEGGEEEEEGNGSRQGGGGSGVESVGGEMTRDRRSTAADVEPDLAHQDDITSPSYNKWCYLQRAKEYFNSVRTSTKKLQ